MLNNIQLLRAFAAFNVVFLHVIGPAEKYKQPTDLVSIFDGWGASGVDMFFVISGFVMVVSQNANPKSALVFTISRAVRIIPIYWFLTIFFVAIYFSLPQLFGTVSINPTDVFGSFLFISGILGENAPIIHVGWTLEYEMLFYSVFAVAIAVGNGRINYLFVFGVIFGVAFVFSQWILLEFLFGCTAGLIYKELNLSRMTLVTILVSGVALLLASIGEPSINNSIDRAVMWGIPSTLVVFSLAALPQTSSRLARFLGDASYSIYLVQVFTISAFYKLILTEMKAWNGDVLAILCVVFTGVCGSAVYLLIEKPFTNALKARISLRVRTH